MAQLQCSKTLYHMGYSNEGYPCQARGARIRADGKPWCILHDPAAHAATTDAAAKAAAHAALCAAACEGVPDEDLRPGMLNILLTRIRRRELLEAAFNR